MFDCLIPSVEGEKIFRELLPHQNAEDLLRFAATGTHVLNGYHNLKHELGVVYWAYSCAINSQSYEPRGNESNWLNINDEVEMIVSALFHDHNHSGGVTTDDINVERARNFVKGARMRSALPACISAHHLSQNIACTQFHKGTFQFAPDTFIRKCLRDADLMSIYSQEGRCLLVHLFGSELNVDLTSDPKLREALQKNTDFLRTHEMFTPFGQAMKSQYLEESLKKFENHVWSTLRPQPSITLLNSPIGSFQVNSLDENS
jgi:hypothetical protein